MSRRRQRLTPALGAQIAAGVRSGAFPHVAAGAFGVATARLEDWLKRGAGEQAREPFRSFAATIEQAAAQARLRAEMALFGEEPKAWLQLGPGRERGGAQRGAPGWTLAVKPASPGQTTTNALMLDDFVEAVSGAFADERFPIEAKQTVCEMIDAIRLRKAA